MDKKERFQQAKAVVMKYYSQATTQIDSKGKFFITHEGINICNKEMNRATRKKINFDELDLIPQTKHFDSVFEAWVATETLITSNRALNKANKSISDEEITQSPLE